MARPFYLIFLFLTRKVAGRDKFETNHYHFIVVFSLLGLILLPCYIRLTKMQSFVKSQLKTLQFGTSK